MTDEEENDLVDRIVSLSKEYEKLNDDMFPRQHSGKRGLQFYYAPCPSVSLFAEWDLGELKFRVQYSTRQGCKYKECYSLKEAVEFAVSKINK